MHDCPVAQRRFTGKDVLRETLVTQLAVAPDGSSAVYARRTASIRWCVVSHCIHDAFGLGAMAYANWLT